MKILISEIYWQHTEVIGTWLDFFSRRGADITIYYPEFEKNTHNYIHIWAKLYKFTFDTTGHFSLSDYDLVVFNTHSLIVLEKLIELFPTTRFLTVSHYSQFILSELSIIINKYKYVKIIPVNPFFTSRYVNTESANIDAVADLPAKFVLPVCRQLADAVADCRSATSANVSGKNNKNILIIGNSFKEVPSPVFNNITKALQSANYSLTAILYGYNDISGYDFSFINVMRDVLAIDLYKEIEECRFILFLPADYHYCNQLSGTIPLSLTFGRPLITMANVLTPYNIHSFYNIDDPLLLQHLESADRYKEAQAHLQVRLNEIFTSNAEILEDSLRTLGLAGN